MAANYKFGVDVEVTSQNLSSLVSQVNSQLQKLRAPQSDARTNVRSPDLQKFQQMRLEAERSLATGFRSGSLSESEYNRAKSQLTRQTNAMMKGASDEVVAFLGELNRTAKRLRTELKTVDIPQGLSKPDQHRRLLDLQDSIVREEAARTQKKMERDRRAAEDQARQQRQRIVGNVDQSRQVRVDKREAASEKQRQYVLGNIEQSARVRAERLAARRRDVNVDTATVTEPVATRADRIKNAADDLERDRGANNDLRDAITKLATQRRLLASEVAEQLAVETAYTRATARLGEARNLATLAVLKDQNANGRAASVAGQVKVERADLAGQTSQSILNDPELRQRYAQIQADAKAAQEIFKSDASAAGTGNEDKVSAKARRLANEHLENSQVRLQAEELIAKNSREEARIVARTKVLRQQNQEQVEKLVQAEQRRLNGGSQIIGANEAGWFQRLQASAATRQTGEMVDARKFQNLGQFVTSRALTTGGFAVAGAAYYGAAQGIRDLVKQAVTLDRTFATIEAQFEAIGDAASFSKFRSEILGISRDTGVAAEDVAEVGFQMRGAFDSTTEAIQQTREAMKAAVVTGLPIQELTDSLSGIALTYGTSISDVTDLTVQLEEQTGVKASETVKLLGDLAPTAQAAGLSLQQMGAIAASTEKFSGRSAAQISDSFARILPGISDIGAEVLVAYQGFVKTGEVGAESFDKVSEAIARGDNGQAFLQILRDVNSETNTLSESSKQYLAQVIGQRREAQTVLSAFKGADTAVREADRTSSIEGKGEERFRRIQETLDNRLDRLRQSFLQLGASIVRAGLLEGMKDLAGAALTLAQALNVLFEGIRIGNDYLGGTPGRLIAILAATRALTIAFKLLGGVRIADGIASLLGGRRPGAPGVGGGGALGLGANLLNILTLGSFGGLAARGALQRDIEAAAAKGIYGPAVPRSNSRMRAADFATNAALGGTLAGRRGLNLVGKAGEKALPGAANLLGKVGLGAGAAALGAGAILTAGVILIPVGLKFAYDLRKEDKDEYRKIADSAEEFQQGANDEVLRRLASQGRQRSSDSGWERFKYFIRGEDINEIPNQPLEIFSERMARELEIARRKGLLDNAETSIPTQAQIDSGQITGVDRLGKPTRTAVQVDPDKRKQMQALLDEYGRLAREGTPEQRDATALKIDEVLNTLEPKQREALEAEARNLKQVSDLLSPDDKTRDAALAQFGAGIEAAQQSYEAGLISAQDYEAKINETKAIFARLHEQGGPTLPAGLQAAELAFNQQMRGYFQQKAQQRLSLVQTIAQIGGASAAQISGLINEETSKILSEGNLTPEADAQIILSAVAAQQAALQESVSNATSGAEALSIARAGSAIPEDLKARFKEATGRALPNIQLPAATLRAIAQQAIQDKIAEIQVFAAGERDPLRQAGFARQIGAIQAREGITLSERRGGQAAIRQADAEERAARFDNERAQIELEQARISPQNNLEQARAQQRLADLAAREAQGGGVAAELRAQAAKIAADRAVDDAMRAITDSRIALLQAMAGAAGDSVRVADLQVQRSREALNNLLNTGADESAINNARAQVVSDEASARSTRLAHERELAEFDYDMGRITRQQLIAKLESFKILANPDEMRDIELAIRRLKQEASADFQFNLPGNLDLPTLYDARRLNQSGGFGSTDFGAGGSYADNRVITIELNASNAVDGEAAVQTIVAALNEAPRFGTQPRRY